MKNFVINCSASSYRAFDLPIYHENGTAFAGVGTATPFLNAVFDVRTADTDLEETAEKIHQHFNKLGLSYCWWIEAESESPRLEQILQKYHMKPVGEFPGMAVGLLSMKPCPSTDLEISAVDTKNFSVWSEVLARVFQFSDADMHVLNPLF